MKIGFLILAHKNPNQLKDLITSLLTIKESRVYIHIDLKSVNLFSDLLKHFSNNKNVLFIEEKYKVSWGAYSQIKATYALIKEAVKSKTENYFMLISGQDFPIKKPIEILNFLNQNNNKEFLINFKLPNSQWENGGMNRLGIVYFESYKFKKLVNLINRLIAMFQTILNLKRKTYFTQFGGTNWFNLSYNCLFYINNNIEQNPKYLKSFKHSLTADEIFIQSIVLNSSFAKNVISEDLRFTDWVTGPEYPKILTENYFDKLITTENKLFARKFDSEKDSEIINKLKKYFES